MLRKVWEVSPNWTVRSKVLVACTLAATLLLTHGKQLRTDREKVTWSISSNSIKIVGFGTKRRYLTSKNGRLEGHTFQEDREFPHLL